MLIPLTLTISDEQKTPKQVEFYVQKPTVLTPRRQNSVKFCDVQKRKIVVREIWKSEEKNPDLLEGKPGLPIHLGWFKGNFSKPNNFNVFDNTIPGDQDGSKVSEKNICTANELKLSIPNLTEQHGHFQTIIYCRCHKMSRVVSC